MISPILPHLSEIACVCLVPYGVLHYIPLHALECDETTLLDSAAVGHLPSVTVAIRHQHSDRVPAGGIRTFVVGNPTGDLSAAEREATVVAQLFETTPLIGRIATIDRVRGGLHGADVVHIAAHASFSSADPFASGILLANGAMLTGRDIMGERLDAALVVLSACETGVQHVRVSNSLAGLTRAFLYAGARALVVSLWPVDDVSTMLLLTRFYQGVAARLGVSEALRRAQLSFRPTSGATDVAPDPEAGSFTDPYYWAPFLVVGVPE